MIPKPPAADIEQQERDAGLDKTIADSFPASDPLSTNPDPPKPPDQFDELQSDRPGKGQESHPKAPSGR